MLASPNPIAEPAVLVPAPPPLTPLMWRAAIPFLERALDEGEGEFALDDLKRAIEAGTMQLWLLLADDGVIGAGLTEILRYPRKTSAVLRLFAAEDGRRIEWLPHLAHLERWAKAEGCDAIEAIGRPGWQRVLRTYRQTHVCLRKDL